MSWFQQSANEQEAAKDHYCMVLAVDGDFPSGHVRVSSIIGELTIDGETYTGFGEFLRTTYPSERSTLTGEKKTFQLAGANLDPAIVSESDINNSFGRTVVEYFCFLHPETRQAIADAEVSFVGFISSIGRSDGASPSITVNAEDESALLDQNDGWRFTDEHQQLFYPGDKGFSEMARIELQEILWGGRRLVQTSAGGRSGRGLGTRTLRP